MNQVLQLLLQPIYVTQHKIEKAGENTVQLTATSQVPSSNQLH